MSIIKLVDEFYKRQKFLMKNEQYSRIKTNFMVSGIMQLELYDSELKYVVESCDVCNSTSYEMAISYLESIWDVISASHVLNRIMGLKSIHNIPDTYESIKTDYIKRINSLMDAKEVCLYHHGVYVLNKFVLNEEELDYVN